MAQSWLTPFRELFGFLIWWVWVVPRRIIVLTKEWLLDTDDVLVLGETIRLWLAIEPLFGDYNWQGRLIGFLFRFIRILISLGIYIGVAVLGLVMLIAWLLVPVVAIVSIFNLW